MTGDVDFAAEGLLEGLEGAAREGRLALLRELHADGVALDELRAAVAEQRLALLPIERRLAAPAVHTAADVAQATGLDLDILAASSRAMGLPAAPPAERAYTEDDLAAARRLKAILDAGMSPEGALELSRAVGRSMAQTAAAMRLIVGTSFLRPGDTEHDLAHRLAAGFEALMPTLAPTLERAFSLHLRALLRSDTVTADDLSGTDIRQATDVVVAFADLVGFTRLGGELPADRLGEVASRLEVLAAEQAGPRVRLVKTIGDAVMLVSRSGDALLESLLGLLETAEGEELPALRCGVAMGDAVERDGDFFGHAVNLASRVTTTARPGSVLVTEAVREAAGDAYTWSFAGARRLRGVADEIKLFRARAATPDEPGA